MALTLVNPPAPLQPAAFAYKEWAGVCRALGEGRQTILIRKGGIAESAGAFHPEHPAFWLYPTNLHEAQQGLRDDGLRSDQDARADRVRIDLLAVVGSVTWVDRLDLIAELRSFHVWTEETILKRFAYRTPGLWVLGVRVYRRSEPLEVAILPEHAGCRTWVPLDPAPQASRLTAVLSDEVDATACVALAHVLAVPAGAR